MQTLVEEFLQYLRHERGQAEHTQRTYAGLLHQFTTWAATEKLTDWKQVELPHLMAFLQRERQRPLMHEPKEPPAASAARVFISRSPRCAPSIALPKMKNCCRRMSPNISPCRAAGSGCRNH